MKRLTSVVIVLGLVAVMATSAFAAEGKARVRVVHASPDAPAVDVWANGALAFKNAPFKGITQYASLDAGNYDVQVVPAGATTPVVIKGTLGFGAGKDYTVIALGKLADIAPIVLEDNNALPEAGKAHVRFVHASPDAPAVDIAVKNGPVLFKNVAFKGVGEYLPVAAGTYDLEVRLAGTNTVALSVPGVKLDNQTVYTIFAMGLASGQPTLTAVPSVDAAPVEAPMPTTLPATGGSQNLLWAIILAAGGLLMFSGIALRGRIAKVEADK
jgi:hypothetical protein